MLLQKRKNKNRKTVNINNRKTTEQTIPILTFDTSGIFEVKPGIYSMTMSVTDINYSLSRYEDQEEIFLQFAKTLNYFTSDVNVEITLNNENLQVGSIKNTIQIKCGRNDGQDEYREEFNEMLLSNATEGKNTLRKAIYITISSECKNINEARTKLNKVMAEVSANLKRVGAANSVLILEERGEVLHNFFRNGSEGEFEFNRKKDISLIDAIAPLSLEFRTDYFKMGNKYCRGLFLANLPSFLSDKFTSDIMEFDSNIMVSIHMQGQDIDKTMKMLNNKITSLKAEEIKAQETAAKNNRFTFSLNPRLREAMDEVEEFKDMILNKNQKVFFTTYILVHMADSKVKLDEDTKTLQSIAGKNLCKLRTLKFQQEEALRTVLPLGINELSKVNKCLTTESATVLSIPFNSVEYLQNNGFYYGKNALTGNMIMIDKQSLKNQNAFVLGSPGSGKSFTVKREIVNVDLVTEDSDIFIIDPENEYWRICKALGGEVIEISVNSNTHINPLDMEYDAEEDPLRNKCDFMLTICNMILGGKDGLTPTQKTILDRVCHKVFKEYIAQNYNKQYQPTLIDFLDILEKEPEREAKNLAIGLEIYCRGSLDLFAHKTNVNVKNRLQVYNIQKLGNALKPLGLQISLETIWQKIVKNREIGRQTVVVCDEAHLLFGEGNSYSANYMQALYKRSRKYNAWITCISQNITGMLDDPIASSLIANSDFLQILNQSPQDKAALADLLGLSDLQLSYVSNANPGEGLLIVGQTNIIPFQDKFPKHLKLYRYMTSNPEEIKKFEEEDRINAEKERMKKLEISKKATLEESKDKEEVIYMPKSVAKKMQEQEQLQTANISKIDENMSSNNEENNIEISEPIKVDSKEYNKNVNEKLKNIKEEKLKIEKKIKESEKMEELIRVQLKALKNSNEREIYCVEDDEIYNSIDELQEKWGLKGKKIISDVCNKKVKKMQRQSGKVDYIQETLKDRRDGRKKHIMWYDEYLKIKKDA